MSRREMPYHVAIESRMNSTTLFTCSSRNHQNAKYATLWNPRKMRMPSSTRSQFATGEARRCRKISESSCQGRMERIRAIEDRDAVLERKLGSESVNRGDRRGQAQAPR